MSFGRTCPWGLIVLGLVLLAAVGVAGQETQGKRAAGGPGQRSAEAEKQGKRPDDPARRAVWFLRGRMVRGESPALLLQRAYKQRNEMREQRREQRLRQKLSPFTTGSEGVTGSEPGSIGSTPAATGPLQPLAGPTWEPLGPTIITGMGRFQDAAGRVTAVHIDQSDTTGNTVYIGGAYGGVWKTTNGTAAPGSVVWNAIYDTDEAAETLAVGAITVQPGNSNVILVGTGEAHNALDSYYGMGILRSTDGGVNWEIISTADSGTRSFRGLGITRFAWGTANPNFVVASAAATPIGVSAGLFGLNPTSNGLYWSDDAGATWHYALSIMDGGATTQVHRVTDVVYNAALGKFYAAMRYHGIYESSDGKSWTRMTNQPGTGLTTTTCTPATNSSCPFYRGQLAVRPGSAEMYASWVTSANPDAIGAIQRTLDGVTWTNITITGINSCGDAVPGFNSCGGLQGWYDQFLMAMPNKAFPGTTTDVYFGTVNIYKCVVSSNATTGLCAATSGTSNRWLNITRVYGHFGEGACFGWTTIHPDQQAMDFLVADQNIAYFGNDGGVYRTLTSNALVNTSCTGPVNPFQDLNNTTLGSLTQFISFSQHPTASDVILGGTQDNGSPGMSTADSQTSGTQWFEAWGGDGGFNEIDQTNPDNWYVTNTDVSIQKCTTGRNCITVDPFASIVTSTQVGGDAGAFYTPYILDPADQTKIIVGTCRVWRGPNTSAGWSASNALSPNFEPGGTLPCDGGETNLVRSLAAGGPVTSGVSSVIYAGTDGGAGSIGGHIWVTTNSTGGTGTWVDRTGSINPGGFPISYIALDPADATGQTAYVTIMGFTGNANGAGHLFKTTNAGISWTDVGIGLPDSPADAVAVDPRDSNAIYVATDVGVFVTLNGGATWKEHGEGLPNVTPMAMRIFDNGTTKKLRIATHGRGVWQTDLAQLNDYSLTADDTIVTVRKGDTATFEITAARAGSFSAAVALSCAPDPPATGAACSVTPNPADLTSASSVPVTLDVSTNAGTTPYGDAVFNLHGDAGGGMTQDLALTLRVNDFGIGSGTGQQTIEQTGTGTYTVTITPQGNFSDPIALSCANFSTNNDGRLGCSFSRNNFAPGAGAVDVTVTVTATAGAQLGAGTFDVVATGDGASYSVNLGYTVTLIQDFSLTGDTTARTVLAGNTGAFAGTLTPLNGFSATISLSCAGLPAGAACNFSPMSPTIDSPTPQPLAINVTTTAGTTPTGVFPITVTASGGGKSRDLPITLTVQNFTLAISPASRTIPPGAGTTFTVTTTGQNGFTGLVTLGCTSPPANATCSYSPATVNASSGGATSTLTVLTTTSITAGAKTITANGAADGQTRNAPNATLSVSTTTPSFSITNSTATKMVNAGSSTSFTLSVRATTTTSPGSVTLSCAAPLPVGVACSFNPATFTPTTTARTVTATVTTTGSTPVASYTLDFRGATTSQFKQASGTLQVQDFTLDVAPNTQIIPAPGGQTTYTVTLTSLSGFSASASLSCTGLPAGWSCGFSPASVTPAAAGANSTLTLTTTATPFGPTNFTVQAVSGSLTRTQQISVTNGANDYQLVLNGGTALAAVRPGQTATWSVNLNRFGNFSANIAESCVYTSTSPTGTACNIAPNPADLTAATCPGNGLCQTASLAIPTNPGTTVVGDYPFNFHGDGGGSQKDLALTLRVNDFTVASTTPSQTIEQTGTATYTVNVAGLNNFTDAVALSCANFSTNNDGRLSCSFAPNNFVPGSSTTPVTVTLSAVANADVGAGTFDVVATGGGVSRSTTPDYNLILVQDFTYTTPGVTEIVLPGQGAGFATTLTPLSSFAANIALSCSGLPAGASCSFSPVTTPPNVVAISSATPAPVTVTVQTSSTTPAGNYTITVTGAGGGKTHSVALSLAVQSFTLSVTPASRTIRAGAGTPFSVTVNGQNGLTTPVLLSCVAPPAGITCIPPAAGVNPGTSATMLVESATSTAAGNKTLTISGTTAAGVPVVTRNVTVTISTTVASFSLTSSTPTRVVSVGGSTTFTLSVRSLSTTSPGLVTMSCVTPLPAGIACSFNPASFTPTTTARTVTATVTTTAATPVQAHVLQFQAASASQYRRVNGTLQVADFTLGVSPLTRIISSASGGSTTYTATLTSLDGFATSVALSCTGLPAGWTCGFAPASVTPTAGGASSTLTLTTTSSPLGPTKFNIQATGGGLTRSQPVEVIIGTDFTLTPTPGTITVQQGGDNTTSIGVAAIGSFAGNVTLSCVSPPAGISCGFGTNPVAPGGGSLLTVSADGTVAGGTYALGVQGNSSSPALSHTVNLAVNVPDYAIVFGPQLQNAVRGSSFQASYSLQSLGQYAATVSQSCSIIPSGQGVTCDGTLPPNASFPAGGTVSGNLGVNIALGATLGNYTLRLTTDDGAGNVRTGDFSLDVQDISVTADQSSVTVGAGSTLDVTGDVNRLNGFVGTVSLACSTGSASAPCSIAPDLVLINSGAGIPFTATLSPPVNATAGPYTLTISATPVGSTARTTTVDVTVAPDFSLSVTPASQTAAPGATADYTVSTATQSGFPDDATLTCEVLTAPTGTGCSFDSSTLSPGGSTTLHVTTTGATPGGSYTVRVTATSGLTVHTQDVTLQVGSITVTAPNGGQVFTAGTTTTITWSFSGVSGTVTIELLKGGVLNRTLSTTASVGSGGAGSFNWTILSTQALGDDYRIRVRSNATPTISDTSNADFRINRTGIAVKVPNGGETWAPGSTQTIRWIFFGSVGAAVRIELLKGGVLNRTITVSTAIGSGGSGQFNFVIPASQTVGSDYRVRIRSTTLTTVTDTSDADFAIDVLPGITVSMSPSALQLLAGDTQTAVVQATGVGGYSGGVQVSISGVPRQVLADPVEFSLATGGSQTVSFAAQSDAPSQNVILSISGESGPYSSQTQPTLTVVGLPSNQAPTRTDYLRIDGDVFNFVNGVGAPGTHGVVYDPVHKLFFVANTGGNHVEVISAASRKVIAHIEVPHPYGLDATADFSKIYVGNGTAYLSVIDPVTLAIRERIVTAEWGTGGYSVLQPFALMNGKIGFLTGLGSQNGSLYVWDPISNEVTLALTDLWSASRNNAGTKIVGTGASAANFVAIWDVATSQQQIDSTYEGVSWVPAFNPAGDEFVMLTGSNGNRRVVFLDNQLNVVGDVFLGMPLVNSALYSLDGNLLYVFNTGSSTAYVFDAHAHTLLGKLPSFQMNAGWNLPAAIDETGLIVSLADGGVGFIDSTPRLAEPSTFTAVNSAAYVTPRTGPVSGGTSLNYTIYTDNAAGPWPTTGQVFFGGVPAAAISRISNNNLVNPAVTTPAYSYGGVVNLNTYLPDGNVSIGPQAFSYGPSIDILATTVGTASGGGAGTLVGAGFGTAANSASVSIGGAAASTLVTDSLGDLVLFRQGITFTIPPRAPGRTTLQISGPGGAMVRPSAFRYIPEPAVYLLPGAALMSGEYDPQRHLVYYTDSDRVQVFSLDSRSWLTAMVPPAGSVARRLVGVAISPDASRLVVTDAGNNSVLVLSLPSGATLREHSMATAADEYHVPLDVVVRNNDQAFVVMGGKAHRLGCTLSPRCVSVTESEHWVLYSTGKFFGLRRKTSTSFSSPFRQLLRHEQWASL